MNTEKKCQYSRCQRESDVVYLGKGLCDAHWNVIADLPMNEAHKKLDIKLEKQEIVVPENKVSEKKDV